MIDLMDKYLVELILVYIFGGLYVAYRLRRHPISEHWNYFLFVGGIPVCMALFVTGGDHPLTGPLLFIGLAVAFFGMFLGVIKGEVEEFNENMVKYEKDKLKNVKTTNTGPSFKNCPFCAEEIKFEAIKCKHCFSTLDT